MEPGRRKRENRRRPGSGVGLVRPYDIQELVDWRWIVVGALAACGLVGCACFMTVLTVQFFTLPVDLVLQRTEVNSVAPLESAIGQIVYSGALPHSPRSRASPAPPSTVLSADSSALEVFIVPHSHCDPGWLMSFEQYYRQQVRRILDGVLEELERYERRRFVWAEVSFFQLWWLEQDESKRVRFRALVDAGRVEFVEGGWVQNDEAGPDTLAVLEQLTEGHEWLLRTFGVRPRVGWQIDPFGHSAQTPTLLRMTGLDALVINRIHYRLKNFFKDKKHLEFVWRGSEGLGERSEIFTHVLHTHYSAPMGYDFEDVPPPVGSDAMRRHADQLVSLLRSRAENYRTRKIFVLLGDDFKFQNARVQFDTWDALMDIINSRENTLNIRVRYSTASEYFDSLRGVNVSYPTYLDDFFPYADNSDSYWTGYYSTRPVMKWTTRDAQAFVRTADLLAALTRGASPSLWRPSARQNVTASGVDIDYVVLFDGLEAARQDVALFQHHDGITGTSKEAVVGDYKLKLDRARLVARDAISALIHALLYRRVGELRLDSTLVLSEPVVLGHRDAPRDSLAHPLVLDARAPAVHVVSVVNSLGWTRSEHVRLPVRTTSPNRVFVWSAAGAVPAQLDPVLEEDGTPEKDMYYLYFVASVAPAGVRAYAVHLAPETEPEFAATLAGVRALDRGKNETISDGHQMLHFSPDTGLLQGLTDTQGRYLRCEQSYLEFQTSRSGAYIFRTDGRHPVTIQALEYRAYLISGPLVNTLIVHHHFNGGSRDEIRTSYRLYSSDGVGIGLDTGVVVTAGAVEVVHDVTVSTNRELIVRYDTSINSRLNLYTDNGVEMVHRRINHRPVVESSQQSLDENRYYPVVSSAFLRDLDEQTEFSVFSKQSMGCSSHRSGGLEFMLHRNLGTDDGRGLNEAVGDLSRVHIAQWISWGSPKDVERSRPILVRSLNAPLVVVDCFYSGHLWRNESLFADVLRPLRSALPPNVHLFSLRLRDRYSDDLLLRLQHVYDADEHTAEVTGDLLQTEAISLSGLFERPLARSRLRTASFNRGRSALDTMHRFDGSVGILRIPDEFSGESDGARQNALENGVFISQAAVDIARESAARKTATRTELLQLPRDDEGEDGSGSPTNADVDTGLPGSLDDIGDVVVLDPLEIVAVVMSFANKPDAAGKTDPQRLWQAIQRNVHSSANDSAPFLTTLAEGGQMPIITAIASLRSAFVWLAICASLVLLPAAAVCILLLRRNQKPVRASSLPTHGPRRAID